MSRQIAFKIGRNNTSNSVPYLARINYPHSCYNIKHVVMTRKPVSENNHQTSRTIKNE